MMQEINILNKRILYINKEKFHYDIKLVEKLIELGAIVDYSFMIHDSIYLSIINKLRLPNAKRNISTFYNQIFSKQDYDYVLMRDGMQFDSEYFKKLRRLNPRAQFINFHWDSIRPEYDYLNMIKYFDKVLSFDPKDCLSHPEIQYLPLFYLDEYEQFRKNNHNRTSGIDILFIGNWRNYERYHFVKAVETQCKQNQLRFYYYLYYPIKNQIRALRKGIVPHEAKHKFLTYNEILNLFALTKTVIDFPSSFQTGLTMRTFETLGSGKKLITTNKNIIYEPFYNPEFINVIDMNNLTLSVDFIKSIPTTSMEQAVKDYSIGNYVNKLLQ